MIGAIAVGIAASMIAITLYHARSGDPIPWKDNTLYAVAVDTRPNEPIPSFVHHPEYPPFELTYRDAHALYASNIPMRSVMTYRAVQIILPDREGVKPISVGVRVTTADFFAAFDVPFIYGSGWSRAEDDAPGAVIVLSRFMNQKLFGGANSVGREVSLSGHAYRVIGVIASWAPRPRYYDPNSAFELPEDVFIPFGWLQARKLDPTENVDCDKHVKVDSSFDSLLTEECLFLQYWVEFHHAADRDRYQSFVDHYTDDQRTHGRFPRKNNNWIVNVPTWLTMWDVVGDDSRVDAVLGLVFLGVCALNTLGLMLAKFLSTASISAMRRALGASRMDIVRQHLIEGVLIGILGGAIGMVLTLGGLSVLKGLMYSGMLIGSDNPERVALVQSFVHMDFSAIAFASGLSLVTGVIAGLYPAYRVGRLPPATFLKTQ
jgi:putative ABC transport system permease protein